MEKCVNYQILPHLNLMVEYYRGDVLADDIIKLKERELSDTNHNPNYNSIVFLQDLTIKKLDSVLIQGQMAKFIQYASNNKKVLGSRKTAILTNTPDQVAIGTLYQGDAKKFPIEYKIVSTIEATFEWVDLSVDYYDEINAILKFFRTKNT